MKIVAHCLVKNEENFVWYAINSVINYVDEIMIWDHGSTDRTIEIIKSIKNPKIKFKEVKGDISGLRQKMLDETNSDWIFILDGDEIWFDDVIKNLVFNIKNLTSKFEVIVVPNRMLVGDVFHYQEEIAGKYKIAKWFGHYNIRAIKKTPGLHVEGVYPNEAYVTKDGDKVQDLSDEKSLIFFDSRYLHASFLKRSSKDKKKIKYEIGIEFPLDFYFPEVFFKARPGIVPSPWYLMDNSYKLRAFIETPFKKLKRRII